MDSTFISKLVQCGICGKRMQDPKSLPCTHSFCKNCIDRIHRSLLHATDDLKCPHCENRFNLTCGGAADLPDSITISELLEKSEDTSFSNDINRLCQRCSKNQAICTCVDCNIDICSTCASDHPETCSSGSRNPQIFKIIELDQVRKEVLARKEQVTARCKEHGHFPSRYCLDKACMKLVCPECCIDYHSGHKLDSINSQESLSREKFLRISEKALELQSKVKIEVHGINKSIEKKDAAQKLFTSEVRRRFKEFRRNVSEHEELLIAKVTKKYEKELSELDFAKSKSTNMIHDIQKIIQTVDIAQRIENNIFLVNEQHYLDGQLEQIEKIGTVINCTGRDAQMELICETEINKVFQGQVFQIQEKTDLDEEYDDTANVLIAENEYEFALEGHDETLEVYQDIVEEDSDVEDVYEPKETRSTPSLTMTSNSKYSKRHFSSPNLSTPNRGYQFYDTYYNTQRKEYPARLTFERKEHIDVSSVITGITVTRDDEIVAILGSERKVCIFQLTGKCYSNPIVVKRNWMQPWDAAGSFDSSKRRTTVYVTDSDSQQGSIVSFEIKGKEAVKMKTIISEARLQPKGITLHEKEIYVCDPERHIVIVYQTNGSFKRKIGMSNIFKHPMYIGTVQNDTLVVSDDEKGAVVHLKTNGEYVFEADLMSDSISQVDRDNYGTVFLGDAKKPILHALIDDKIYDVDGDFEGIRQTTAISVDGSNKVIVGHSNGIDILQVTYRYGIVQMHSQCDSSQ